MARKQNPELSRTERRVASKLSALRQQAGLTLDELGARTGLSKSYLSRVENMKAAVNLSSLELLAEAFVVPVSAFLEESGSPRICLRRAGEGKTIRLRGRDGVVVHLLASELHKRMMEPFIVEVNTSGKNVPMQSHEGEEFFYVIEGSCVFHYGPETHVMKKGDSAYFDSGIQHKVEPHSKKSSRLMAIVTSRDFSFHGNLTKLLNE